MPDLTSYAQSKPIKMLLIGDSGSGKTGALVSLAKAGYKLRIQDYDDGLEILAQKLKGSEFAKAVEYVTLKDNLKSVGSGTVAKIIPVGQPLAFSNGLSLLDKWQPPIATSDLGSPSSWGMDTILIIDSLTFMSQCAMRRVLSMGGRAGEQPQIQDWGQAMSNIEDTLSILYSDTIKCHVIITSHIVYIETTDGQNKGYPSTLGNKLPPKVGRWFNQILHTVKKGSGDNMRRVILTQPESNIDVKSPILSSRLLIKKESNLCLLTSNLSLKNPLRKSRHHSLPLWEPTPFASPSMSLVSLLRRKPPMSGFI